MIILIFCLDIFQILKWKYAVTLSAIWIRIWEQVQQWNKKKNLSVVNWEYLSYEWFINIHDVWTVLLILVNFSFMPKMNS